MEKLKIHELVNWLMTKKKLINVYIDFCNCNYLLEFYTKKIGAVFFIRKCFSKNTINVIRRNAIFCKYAVEMWNTLNSISFFFIVLHLMLKNSRIRNVNRKASLQSAK